MGYDIFIKILEIWKKKCRLQKNKFFSYHCRHLGFGKSLLFSKYFSYSHLIYEQRNLHFGTADTHSSMLEISKSTHVNCHLAAILDFLRYFNKKHTHFLNRRSFCNVNTLDMIKYNNCVSVFIIKSKLCDLVNYWPPF